MTSTTNPTYAEAVIEADPQLPIIRITRDFAATPAQLLRAHTDPALFARWVGPDGMDTTVDRWDATSLGSWRYVSRRDSQEFAFHGCFHQVRPDRIVQTFTWEGEPDAVALGDAVRLRWSDDANMAAAVAARAGDRGALDAGCLPTLLPGGRPVEDAAARVDLGAAWGVTVPTTPGRDGTAILSAAATGELGALLIGGVDPVDLLDPAGALAAIRSAGFVVSLELRSSAVTEVSR